MSETERPPAGEPALDRIGEDPHRTALFCDLDGTLAPIVDRPEDVQVPETTLEAVTRAADRLALCAIVTGRPALEARRLIGLDSISYAGNHGIELIARGEEGVQIDPLLAGHEDDARAFIVSLDKRELEEAGLRLEDKGPIVAIHWRGSEAAGREAMVERIVADAEAAGLIAHRGRMVLEIRPAVAIDKGMAVKRLLEGSPETTSAIFIGDDRTDLDAFSALDELVSSGDLSSALKVAVTSAETSDLDLGRRADLCLTDTAEVARFIERIAA